MSCEAIFFERLRERGFRLTPQREMVLSVMHQMEELATAEGILHEVHHLSAAVDISTIYRTLDLLQEFDLVTSVEPADGHRLYKLVGVEGPHLHLICKQCSVVMGVDPAPARPLAAYFLEHHGFEMDLDHLSLSGLCGDCLQNTGSAA